jgi:flagellar motility protein MotE (MotC chaperone)
MQVTSRESVPDYPRIVVADRNVLPNAQGPGKSKSSNKSWAQEMFNYRDAANSDVTGSVTEKPGAPPLTVSNKAPDPPKLDIGGTAYPLEQGKISSPGERAVLDHLQGRREALDTRDRDLEMRESLLKAAQMRLEAKVAELKDVEGRINTAMGNRDQAEAQRFKNIVSMYENMKPKDAARIFDRLDLKILVDVSTQMNSRKMSEILAVMSPEAAERLTVELANRAGTPKSQSPDLLPKIEGAPNGG